MGEGIDIGYNIEYNIDDILSPNKRKSFTEFFDEVFPYFLEMGMTYDLFWNDRVELAKCYIKANQLRNKRKNQEMWQQGLYVKAAIASTVGNMFTKNKSDKIEYPSEPLPITKREYKAMKEKEAKAKFENMKNRMIQASQHINNSKGGG